MTTDRGRHRGMRPDETLPKMTACRAAMIVSIKTRPLTSAGPSGLAS